MLVGQNLRSWVLVLLSGIGIVFVAILGFALILVESAHISFKSAHNCNNSAHKVCFSAHKITNSAHKNINLLVTLCRLDKTMLFLVKSLKVCKILFIIHSKFYYTLDKILKDCD